MGSDPQNAKGTYLLVIWLARSAPITVGRLGTFIFPAGWYAYAGSALGSGGLEARLARHLPACHPRARRPRAEKRLHWHIDYLLQHGTVETIWQIASPARLECAWAAEIRALPDTATPVPGFGASDCRCTAHLVYFFDRPDNRLIAEALRSISPQSCSITFYQTECGESSP